MFRILLHSTPKAEWLSLEGKLAGPGVGELERCWHTLAPSGNGPSLRLDLSRLDGADPYGEQLLSRMRGKGVTLTGLPGEARRV
jgi:hypothetical protein